MRQNYRRMNVTWRKMQVCVRKGISTFSAKIFLSQKLVFNEDESGQQFYTKQITLQKALLSNKGDVDIENSVELLKLAGGLFQIHATNHGVFAPQFHSYPPSCLLNCVWNHEMQNDLVHEIYVFNKSKVAGHQSIPSCFCFSSLCASNCSLAKGHLCSLNLEKNKEWNDEMKQKGKRIKRKEHRKENESKL